MVVKKCSNGKGFGVFTKNFIAAGSFVCELSGRHVLRKDWPNKGEGDFVFKFQLSNVSLIKVWIWFYRLDFSHGQISTDLQKSFSRVLMHENPAMNLVILTAHATQIFAFSNHTIIMPIIYLFVFFSLPLVTLMLMRNWLISMVEIGWIVCAKKIQNLYVFVGMIIADCVLLTYK